MIYHDGCIWDGSRVQESHIRSLRQEGDARYIKFLIGHIFNSWSQLTSWEAGLQED